MANIFYLPALLKLANHTIDPVADDLRVMLVLSSHVSAATDEFLGDFATLGESDGTGYDPGPGGTGRKVLASKIWSLNVAGEQAEMACANITWPAIDADAGPAVAAIIYKHISDSDDSLNPAIVSIDEGGFPFTFTGPDFTLSIPVAGLFQVSQG